MTLNNQQTRVLESVREKKVTVVSAGAGSGKTHTMVAAALDYIGTDPIRVSHLALITFTNKAADELRDRLAHELRADARRRGDDWSRAEEALSGAFVGTIHSFCSRLLSTYGYSELVARSATRTMSSLLRSQAIADVLEEALEEDGPRSLPELAGLALEEYELERLVRDIAAYCHATSLSLDDLAAATHQQDDEDGKAERVAIAELALRADRRYADLKAERALLDADDLQVRLVRLLQAPGGDDIAHRIGKRYPVVFVDEFQDTDRAQKAMLDLLVGHLDKLLVVGDPKQAIYGFKGADHGLLKTMAKEYAHGEMLDLSISRRPTRQLLTVQNTLFGCIGSRYPELRAPLEPWDGTLDGGELTPLLYQRASTPEDEAAAAAAHIEQLIGEAEIPTPDGGRRPVSAGDIVVLCRSNRLVEEFTLALRQELAPSGIEVQRDTGGNLYTSPEIVSTYRMLRLLLDGDRDLSLSMALATPYLRATDPTSIERQLLTAPVPGALSAWFARTHPDLAAQLDELRAAVRTDNAPQFLGRLYRSFGIQEYYRSVGDQWAADNLERLREDARTLFRSEEALTLHVFADWLRSAILRNFEVEEPLASDESPRWVRVMTIHRAKGLEFPIVVIPGAERTLEQASYGPDFFADSDWGLDLHVPSAHRDTRSSHFKKLLEEEARARMDEEMRLLYVAVTRARCAVLVFAATTVRPGHIALPGEKGYAWRDEILEAKAPIGWDGGKIIGD